MDYASKTYKVSEMGVARGVNRDSTGNFSRDQARRLEKKQEHEIKLHEIIRFHKIWHELSAKLSQTDSTLSALSESIKQEKKREKDLSSRNGKLKAILDNLRDKSLSDQEIYLKTLGKSNLADPIKPIIKDILTAVIKGRSEIKKFEGQITSLKPLYQDSYQKKHNAMIELRSNKKNFIKGFLNNYGIEIQEEDLNNYFDEHNQTITSANECFEIAKRIIERSKDFRSKKITDEEDRLCEKAWEELQSTTFYRERVAPLADKISDKISAEYQIGALRNAIELAPNPEVTKPNIEADKAQVKRGWGVLQRNLKKLYSNPPEAVAEGYVAAERLYQALNGQYTKTLDALKMKNTLKSSEAGYQWLEAAIANLNAPETAQEESFRKFTEQSSQADKGMPGYFETNSLYKAIRDSNRERKNANKIFSKLQERVKSSDKANISEVGSVGHQSDDAAFGPKLRVFIEARLYESKEQQKFVSDLEALRNYLNSIAGGPLEKIISANQASISSTKKDIDDYTTTHNNKKREKQTIKRDIQEILHQALNDTGRNISREDLDLFDRYTDDWFIKQRKQHEQAIQRLTSQPSSAQPDSILMTQDIVKQRGTSDQNLRWLKNPMVADYTDKLLEAHRHQYGTEINIDKAVKSAKFLADQKFVGETRKYIEITAGLVHKFDVGLDSFYVNTETLQITIAEEPSIKSFTGGPISDEPLSYGGDGQHARKTIVGPTSGSGRSDTLVLGRSFGSGRSDTLVSDGSFRIGSKQQQENLVPLKFNRYGDLIVEDRKVKGSIIASGRGDPYTWILSIRSPELAFAPNTVMQQSGSVDFKDLGKLEKGGNMDIATIAIAREFEEEAPGYKVVPETIQRVESRSTPTEHVVFFEAEAVVGQKAENTIIDDEQFRETTGTFPLNIIKLIKDNNFNDTNFSNDEGRLAVKRAILEKAVQKGAIQRVPARSDPQWERYFIDSYNVDSMVDYIGKVVKEIKRREPEISWRLRGEERWRALGTSLRQNKQDRYDELAGQRDQR